MKFLRDLFDGVKALGRRETWHQLGKTIGLLDPERLDAVREQAKEGWDDAKSGKRGDLLSNVVGLASKTPVGLAATAAAEKLFSGDLKGAKEVASNFVKKG
jgi:hypothetical protein